MDRNAAREIARVKRENQISAKNLYKHNSEFDKLYEQIFAFNGDNIIFENNCVCPRQNHHQEKILLR